MVISKPTLLIIQPEHANLTFQDVLVHVNAHLKEIGALGNQERIEQSLSLAFLHAATMVGYKMEEVGDWDFIFRHPMVSDKSYGGRESEKISTQVVNPSV